MAVYRNAKTKNLPGNFRVDLFGGLYRVIFLIVCAKKCGLPNTWCTATYCRRVSI